jgi:ABC-type transporter Mla MlaB component
MAMSFQMEVSADHIHLWVQGTLGPSQVAQLRDALAPLLQGRPRDLRLELVGMAIQDTATRAALVELQAYAHQQSRCLSIVHSGETLAEPIPGNAAITG